jgi:4,5-epoxidase
MPTNVLVVGAGPTGLGMGLMALRAGLSVRVVDKAPGPSRFSKAIGLQYRVSELLAQLGLADRFLAAGALPVRVTMYSGPRVLLRLSFFDFGSLAGKGAFAPVSIMIPQSDTEHLLGRALNERGASLEWGTELEELSQSSAGVTALLRRSVGGREEAEADWVVGCDGAHSAVRKLLGLSFGGKSVPVSFLIADVESGWPRERESVHVWFHRDGSVAAMPLPAAGTWRLFVETTRQSTAEPLRFDDVARVVSERTGQATVDVGRCLWQSDFSINCRMVDRLRVGRVFLAGDAAHVHSPTGGQGIATALQDVANLAWKLGQVQRGAASELLDSYGAERLPAIRRVLEATDRNTNIFVAPTRALRILRDFVVLPMLRRGAVQRKLVRSLSQLDVSYRAGPLAQHSDAGSWRNTRIRAGDRAPDVVFSSRSEGGDDSLFALLRKGSLVALIGLGGGRNDRAFALATALRRLGIASYGIAEASTTASDPAGPLLRDRYGELRRLYGMTGSYACIIRPDGHVGLFQRPVQIEPVKAWLMRLCPAGAVRAAFASIDADAAQQP